MRSRDSKLRGKVGRAALVGAALPAVAAALSPTVARADQIFVTSTAPIDANPSAGRKPSTGKATRDDGSVTIGDVLFNGNLIAGGVYNDNLYSSRFNKVSDVGFNIAPNFTLRRDVGVHSTTVTGNWNSQLYTNNSNANVNTGALAMSHVYEVQRDLIVFLQGHVSRNQNLAPFQAIDPKIQLEPSYYNEEYFSGSVEKSFDRFSIGGGASIVAQQYQSFSDTAGNRFSARGLDGTNTTVTGRFGYAVTPLIQAYIQPSYNWQTFQNSALNAQGYSIVGGLRSDRIGLFRGDIFGGYQTQRVDLTGQSSSGPTFGGAVSWYPTRDLTFRASLSQSYGLTSGVAFQGSTARSTVASLSATYEFSRTMTSTASLSYSESSFGQTALQQQTWTAGAQVNYMFTSHLGVNAGYTFTRVSYSLGYGGYDRNLITLGASGRF